MIGAGGRKQGADPGVTPCGGGVERRHLHPVPAGAIHRRSPLEEELHGGHPAKERRQVERAEAVGGPGRHVVARIEKLGELVGTPESPRLEEVERRAAVHQGGEDILLPTVEGGEDGRKPLMIPRVGQRAVTVEERVDPGAVTRRDGGEELLGIGHAPKLSDIGRCVLGHDPFVTCGIPRMAAGGPHLTS